MGVILVKKDENIEIEISDPILKEKNIIYDLFEQYRSTSLENKKKVIFE